jgi:hypothetical protein
VVDVRRDDGRDRAGSAVVPLWWLFARAAALGIVPMPALHGVAYPVRWWRRPPAPRALAWLVPAGVVLTLAGLAVAESPPWVGLLPVAAAGPFDALSWVAATDAVARPRRSRAPGSRANPVGLRTPAARAGGARLPQPAHDRACRRAAPGPRFTTAPFSHRGLGAHGRPLRYGPEDTYRSLEASAAPMDRQVHALRRATGQDVALVGGSEGSLVVKHYLLTHPRAPVDESACSG